MRIRPALELNAMGRRLAASLQTNNAATLSIAALGAALIQASLYSWFEDAPSRLSKAWSDVNVTDAAVRAAVIHIEEHLPDPDLLEQVADLMGLSPRQTSRRFSAALGRTASQHIALRRFARAHELLTSTSATVGEISAAVGLGARSYFSLSFKKATGLSPREFRARRMVEHRRSDSEVPTAASMPSR